jgi:drug/metabolite transporter (DMT)-like permease
VSTGAGHVRHARPIGLVAMLAAVLTFSAGSTLVRKSGVPGPTVAFWRMLGASIVWMAVLRVTQHRFVTKQELRRAALAGALIGINTTLFYTAATKTSVANLEFIGALSPLVLLPVGAAVFHEKVDRRAAAFGIISIVGLAVVLFNAPPRGVATWSGNGLAIIALGTWCSYIVASRQLRAGMSVVVLMAAALPTATLMALPVTLVNHDIGDLDGRAVAYIVVLTAVTGVGAHGLLVFAQRNVPVGIMSLMQVGQPALAVVWSAVFLSQSIRALQLVGMAMVVSGLAAVIVQTQRGRAKLVETENGELAGSAG